LTNAALLQAWILLSETMEAWIQGRKSGIAAMTHMAETVRMANEALYDPERSCSDASIATIHAIAIYEVSTF
jgi:hypothetical protein